MINRITAVGLVIALTATVLFVGPVITNSPTETVELKSDGVVVSTISAELAETRDEKITGLSQHDGLPDGEGMLFIYDVPGEHTYVMPDMDFGIDIVFIDQQCAITSIHSADKPIDGETGYEEKHRYTGQGKYVLEVPQDYATDRVDVGDTVSFESGC